MKIWFNPRQPLLPAWAPVGRSLRGMARTKAEARRLLESSAQRGTKRKKGKRAPPEEAARLCGRFIGRPIAITSIVLSLGFLAVAFSGFASLREFGILAAATMVICLFTDLILLPALLVRARV